MGTTLCSLGHSSPRRLPRQESSGGCVGLSASIIEFMKPQCLLKKKKRLQPLNKEDVKQEPLPKNASNLLTLREWILSSPNRNGCNSRIYPTLEVNHESLSNNPGDSFSMNKFVMEVSEGDTEMEVSSSTRSLGGKTKKRVSFRLPEVADIFILDSPGEYSVK